MKYNWTKKGTQLNYRVSWVGREGEAFDSNRVSPPSPWPWFGATRRAPSHGVSYVLFRYAHPIEREKT